MHRVERLVAAAKAALSKSAKLQGEIRTQAATATRLSAAHLDAAKLLLPSLNAMIDVTTTRTMARQDSSSVDHL
jgi:hypothetical protein